VKIVAKRILQKREIALSSFVRFPNFGMAPLLQAVKKLENRIAE